MRLTLAIMAMVAAGCAARQPMVIQNAVQTRPPASFWICPTPNRCDASVNPSDIPSRYVCISQANGITVCSPGGNVKMTPKQIVEHLLLGAGCYGALYAIAGSGRQGAVAGSGCALVAGAKEGSDAYAGRDTRKQAVIHAITILAGAGAVAAFKH